MKLTGCKARELQAGNDSLNEYIRIVMEQRSKVNVGSYPQKAHQLDMKFIPTKHETDWVHNKGTTGQKRQLE